MPVAIICGFCSETVRQMNKWQTIEPLVEMQAVFYVQKEREKIEKYSIIYTLHGATQLRKYSGKPLFHYEHWGVMCVACGWSCSPGQRTLFMGHFSTDPEGTLADRGLCVGDSSIKALLLSGWKRTIKRIAGSMALASGRGATRKFACWLPGRTRSGRLPTSFYYFSDWGT